MLVSIGIFLCVYYDYTTIKEAKKEVAVVAVSSSKKSSLKMTPSMVGLRGSLKEQVVPMESILETHTLSKSHSSRRVSCLSSPNSLTLGKEVVIENKD